MPTDSTSRLLSVPKSFALDGFVLLHDASEIAVVMQELRSDLMRRVAVYAQDAEIVKQAWIHGQITAVGLSNYHIAHTFSSLVLWLTDQF